MPWSRRSTTGCFPSDSRRSLYRFPIVGLDSVPRACGPPVPYVRQRTDRLRANRHKGSPVRLRRVVLAHHSAPKTSEGRLQTGVGRRLRPRAVAYHEVVIPLVIRDEERPIHGYFTVRVGGRDLCATAQSERRAWCNRVLKGSAIGSRTRARDVRVLSRRNAARWRRAIACALHRLGRRSCCGATTAYWGPVLAASTRRIRQLLTVAHSMAVAMRAPGVDRRPGSDFF